jgi:hypothetical protein
MIHSSEKAKVVWVNRMVQGFQLVAHITHDKFRQLDDAYGLVDMLFDRYDVGHEVAASYTIEAMYSLIPDASGMAPYSEDGCIDAGVN